MYQWNLPYRKDDLEAGGGSRSRPLYPSMHETPELRWGFIRKVYSIIAFQLLATIAVSATVVTVRPIALFFATTGAGLGLYIVIIITPFIGFFPVKEDIGDDLWFLGIVEDAKFYYIAAFSPSMYHQTPYSRHMNMPLQTPRDKQDSCLNQVHGVCFGMRLRQESAGFTAGRQYKTTLVITQVADHVVFATDGKVEKYPVIHLPRRSGFNRL
ncbi:hypothetical protein F2Q70_00016717, partial [Brassica cretica]